MLLLYHVLDSEAEAHGVDVLEEEDTAVTAVFLEVAHVNCVFDVVDAVLFRHAVSNALDHFSVAPFGALKDHQ